MKFYTKLFDSKPAVKDPHRWKDIVECAGMYDRAVIEVREYDENAEISEDQRKWLHCEAGPIRLIINQYHWSFRDSKEYCKVEWGRQWFVVELTDENIDKTDGIFRWECRKSTCRKLHHATEAVYDVSTETGEVIRVCPNCTGDLYPIAIKSIMKVSHTKVNLWFREMIEHFPRHPESKEQILFAPDKEWFKNKEKKEQS